MLFAALPQCSAALPGVTNALEIPGIHDLDSQLAVGTLGVPVLPQMLQGDPQGLHPHPLEPVAGLARENARPIVTADAPRPTVYHKQLGNRLTACVGTGLARYAA